MLAEEASQLREQALRADGERQRHGGSDRPRGEGQCNAAHMNAWIQRSLELSRQQGEGWADPSLGVRFTQG